MIKLVSKKYVEKFDLYDITVDKRHCFKLKNGVVAHNSLFPEDVVSGGCVVAGTQVRMADGNTKAIEDIRVDEIVATAAGTFKVTHTWDPETLEEGHPECYEITFEDGTVETISYNDHLMIDGKMVQIQDIKAGDLIDIYK